MGEIETHPGAATIADAVETAKIDLNELAKGVEKDGLPIPALVTQLKAQTAADQHNLVHRGLTSQDVIDTSTVLAMLNALALLAVRLKDVEAELEQLQTNNQSAALMAMTRMQPALKTSAVEVVSRWRQPIPTLLRDLAKSRADIGQVQWGGPIGTRDHPQAQALGVSFAKRLGLNDPGEAWHTDRAAFVNAGHVMTRTATAMGKIGEDIALMSSIGADQITFAGGGSSAMPHKNNPVAAEIAIALSDHCIALNAGLMRSARHEGFRSGRAWTLEWLVLPQICIATGAALLQINRMLQTIVSIGDAG